MATPQRGRLVRAAAAPPVGEEFVTLAALGNVTIDQILSGITERQEFLQDHDEWVVVLDGAATIELDGDFVDLGPGDWIVLPAGVPHAVVHTEPETRWLAVHVAPR